MFKPYKDICCIYIYILTGHDHDFSLLRGAYDAGLLGDVCSMK